MFLPGITGIIMVSMHYYVLLILLDIAPSFFVQPKDISDNIVEVYMLLFNNNFDLTILNWLTSFCHFDWFCYNNKNSKCSACKCGAGWCLEISYFDRKSSVSQPWSCWCFELEEGSPLLHIIGYLAAFSTCTLPMPVAQAQVLTFKPRYCQASSGWKPLL